MSAAATRALLDHLVVGAATLDQGVGFIRDLCGVTMPFGGVHPRMGTHNHLTRLGEGIFLEVIAIDPQAPRPEGPRWFGLDDPAQRARLAERPRLIAWVAGVPSLAALGDAIGPFGRPQELTRGDLTWQIAFPQNGQMTDGVLPALIEWPPGPHPSARMADQGLRFERLDLHHPEPARIRDALTSIGADHLVGVSAGAVPGLSADIRRADGRRVTLD